MDNSLIKIEIANCNLLRNIHKIPKISVLVLQIEHQEQFLKNHQNIYFKHAEVVNYPYLFKINEWIHNTNQFINLRV